MPAPLSPLRLTPEAARRAVSGSLGVFALLVPLTVAGANIAWGLVLASLLAYAAAGGRVPWEARRSAIEKPLYLYLAAAALATFLSVDPDHSMRFLNKDFHKVWLYLLFSVSLAVAEPQRLHLPLGLGFAVAAAVGVGQALLLPALNPDGTAFRAHAFVHPVTYGEQMAVGLLGALCFLIGAEKRSKGERWTAATLAALTAAALVLSRTRMAMAGCAAGLASVCLLRPGLRRLVPVATLLAVAPLLAPDRMRYSRTLVEEASAWLQTGEIAARGQFSRLALWSAAWRMGLDRPWTGVGLNAYPDKFQAYFHGDLEAVADMMGNAHNLYLHQFAERGLIGLAALLAFLGAFWLRALQRARAAPEFLNLWAFGAASAFFLMNLTETALQTELLYMLVLFAWLAAERRPAS